MRYCAQLADSIHLKRIVISFFILFQLNKVRIPESKAGWGHEEASSALFLLEIHPRCLHARLFSTLTSPQGRVTGSW